MAEKRLGRGLEYLLSKTHANEKDSDDSFKLNVYDIPSDKIKTNRFQPRSSIDEESLTELVESIKENGVLQPILLRKSEEGYELIAGERRYRACLKLGLKTIPSIVIDVPDNKLLQLALIENIQREDLNPIEEAQAYQTLMDLEDLTHEELAKRIGKKRSTITNILRLLELPPEIQEDVSRGTLSQGHARALLSISKKEKMLEVAESVKKEGLTVRAVERIAREHSEKHNKVLNDNKLGKKETKNQEHHLEDHIKILKDIYGTPVSIKWKGKKGELSFSFFSHDDFTRLYLLLTKYFNEESHENSNSILNP